MHFNPLSILHLNDGADDDTIAVMLLAAHQDQISIEASIVAGNGFAHAEPGAKNMVSLFKFLNLPDIPVVKGALEPLKGKISVPKAWREGSDNLEIPICPYEKTGRRVREDIAEDFIISTLHRSAKKVTLLCTGPMTDLALALRKDATITQKIDRIVMMGGAVNVPGNTDGEAVEVKSEFAEWNVYIDPLALHEVLQAGIPFEMVPLDATNEVKITREYVAKLKKEATTNLAKRIVEVMEKADWAMAIDQYFAWDQLAAAYLIDPKVLIMEEAKISVDTEIGHNFGRTFIDEKHGTSIRYAKSANGDLFLKLFEHAINREIN